jgi:hypothetical protein
LVIQRGQVPHLPQRLQFNLFSALRAGDGISVGLLEERGHLIAIHGEAAAIGAVAFPIIPGPEGLIKQVLGKTEPHLAFLGIVRPESVREVSEDFLLRFGRNIATEIPCHLPCPLRNPAGSA